MKDTEENECKQNEVVELDDTIEAEPCISLNAMSGYVRASYPSCFTLHDLIYF